MNLVPFYITHAFSKDSLKGNAAGVVNNADDLTEQQMQQIATELKCSETAFILTSNAPDYKLRFFSPIREVDLCGHATIATFHTLKETAQIRKNTTTIETNVGVLKVDIKDDLVTMEQNNPIFKDTEIDISEIADCLNINKVEIFDDIPIGIVSTGIFSIKTGIKSLKTMRQLKPNFEKIERVCREVGAVALFVFTFETEYESSYVHCRCFAPVFGVNEDPVTGTANGALGAFLKKHNLLKTNNYWSEQGFELGKNGLVNVEVSDKVKVGGYAHIAVRGTIDLADSK